MSVDVAPPILGEGAYTLSEAAAIIQHVTADVSVRQLRYWISSGLNPVARTSEGRHHLLSFDDLVSLAIVGRFKDMGTSLQRVRRLEAVLREEYPGHLRPFAYRTFFTDGANMWVQEFGREGAVREVVGARRGHYAWQAAIKTFAEEIRYNDDLHAVGWDLSPWVQIDPLIQFGTPVVRGTRVPVRTVVANLGAGSPEQVADWYGLTVDQVIGAKEYHAIH